MTEEQWLACDSPMCLLRYRAPWGERGQRCRRVRARQLRLCGCACLRLVWEWIPDELTRTAIKVAERFAEGDATDEERSKMRDTVMRMACSTSGMRARLGNAAVALLRGPKRFDLSQVLTLASTRQRDTGPLLQQQASLLRDILGNPFRPVPDAAGWRTTETQVVARAAIAGRCPSSGRLDPADMAVLADALEDAGCTDLGILSHLRSAQHVQGCWAVDLIWGK